MNILRLNKVRNNMREEGLSQILVTGSASVYYLTSVWCNPHERMLALYIDLDGRCALFGNKMFGITVLDGADLYAHSDGEDPVSTLAAYVKAGQLGIDKTWPSLFLISLMEKRPDLMPVLGSRPVDAARMRKDAQEIETMRNASSINDMVMESVIEALCDGVTESELAALTNGLFREHGSDGESEQLACFGANAADPHHGPGDTVIRPGDCAVFDIFSSIGRYWCDMTRTVFFKSADREQETVYELVRKANESAEKMIKPGVPLREIDRTARSVIEQGGYGQYFTHRLGHGIGVECHEPPDVNEASTVMAEPGMTFSVEPGIYLPGKVGVRIEDLVLVTEDGCEVLNRVDKNLTICK